jgi:diacylglycerol kinase (ATP)
MSLVRSTENSLAGLAHALKTEKALRLEVAVLVAFVPLSLIVGTDFWQRAVLIASCLFVLSVELLNTCVEKLCDHVTPVLHPQVKVVKDMGSAAVFCSLLATGLLWLSAVLARLGVG